ncbi:MAG: S41 family peptidase, partial [Kiloniellales bacterium]
LSGNGAMRLTTARYYTPSGTSIQGSGIKPDIVVEQARIETVESKPRRREADLRGALDKGGQNGAPPDDGETGAKEGDEKKPSAADPDQVDFQLARALDLLRGLAFFNSRVIN